MATTYTALIDDETGEPIARFAVDRRTLDGWWEEQTSSGDGWVQVADLDRIDELTTWAETDPAFPSSILEDVD